MDLTPINTEWNGHRFRSRLEARWAVFMDSLGVGYRYESEGYGLGGGLRYLPDFYIPAWDAYLEIKPGLPEREEIAKATTLARQHGKPVYMLVGTPWPDEYEGWRWDRGGWCPSLRWSACGACWPKAWLVVPDPTGATCRCPDPVKEDALALQSAFTAARGMRFERVG